jgi:hypothetical protein
MDVHNAILLRYADVVNVGSNNIGDCAPAIDGGNIDRRATNFDNCMWCTSGGVNNDSGERMTTLAVVRGSGWWW